MSKIFFRFYILILVLLSFNAYGLTALAKITNIGNVENISNGIKLQNSGTTGVDFIIEADGTLTISTPSTKNTAITNGLTVGSGNFTIGTDGAVFASSTINALTGFKINGSATLGNLLRGDGTNFVSWTPNYLTDNQTITLSGDVSGTGTTSIAVTVSKINGVALTSLGTGILKILPAREFLRLQLPEISRF